MMPIYIHINRGYLKAVVNRSWFKIHWQLCMVRILITFYFEFKNQTKGVLSVTLDALSNVRQPVLHSVSKTRTSPVFSASRRVQVFLIHFILQKHHNYKSSSCVIFPLSPFFIPSGLPSIQLGVSKCLKRLHAFELHVQAIRGSAVYLHFQRLNSIRWAIYSHSLLLPSVPLPPFFPLSLSIALYLPLRTVNVLTFHSMGHSLS